MRRLLAAGLSLALAMLVAPVFAEELDWHPAPPRPAQPPSAASIVGENHPASREEGKRSPDVPVTAQAITLSKPMPLDPAVNNPVNPGVTPILFQRLVRAKPDEVVTPAAPLPSGPPLPSEVQKPKDGEKEKVEEIPIEPTPLKPTPMQPTPMGNGPWGDGIPSYSGNGDGIPSFSGNGDGADYLGIGGGDGCSDDCCCGDDCSCYRDPGMVGGFLAALFGGAGTRDGCRRRGNMYWVSMEYLLWTTKAGNVPPLLTTAPPGSTGALGNSDTATIFASNVLPSNTRNGARVTAGFWLPGVDRLGLEASYFFLGQRSNLSQISSTGVPVLARPIINVATVPTSSAIATAYPAGFFPPFIPLSGSFAVQSQSYMWGAELNLRGKLLCGPGFWVDALAGYRHLQLQESIDIFDLEVGPSGTAFVHESFFTRNQFNGVQLGIESEWNFWGRWFLRGQFKVAMGPVHETVNIAGTTNFGPPFNTTVPGGVLALATNSGVSSRDRFAVLPEVGVKLGYNLTDNLRLFVAYDFMYISNVLRAGNEIDLNINPNFIPGSRGFTGVLGGGPRRPAVLFHGTDYWAQGVNFGAEWRW